MKKLKSEVVGSSDRQSRFLILIIWCDLVKNIGYAGCCRGYSLDSLWLYEVFNMFIISFFEWGSVATCQRHVRTGDVRAGGNALR